MLKFVFVIGGVVFSIGKGIVVVSLGWLLKFCYYFVFIFKFDFYINVDFGIMSFFQYGEVFVIEDGVEIDLDLGYYECFIDIFMFCFNSVIIGFIY